MYDKIRLITSIMIVIGVVTFASIVEVKAQVLDVINTDKLARIGVGDPANAVVSTTTGKPSSSLSILTFGIGSNTNWPWGMFCHLDKLSIVRNWNNLYAHQVYMNDNGNMAINVPLPMPAHPSSPWIDYAPTFELEVFGHIRCNTLTVTSDKWYKTNIESIPVNKVADLYKVNAVQYNSSSEILRKQREQFEQGSKENLTPEEIASMRLHFDSVITERDADTRTYYGVIAQDLEKVYPDLVYEDLQGFLSVNYSGLIPIMLDAIKELKEEINFLRVITDSLRGQLNYLSERITICCPEMGELKDSTGGGKPQEPVDSTGGGKPQEPVDSTGGGKPQEPPNPQEPVDSMAVGRLLSNQPNPFTESTEIFYYIPESALTASIVIYDMEGVQLMIFDLTASKGYSSVKVDGSRLGKGTYIYSLIVDDKEVDSKKMLLTE